MATACDLMKVQGSQLALCRILHSRRWADFIDPSSGEWCTLLQCFRVTATRTTSGLRSCDKLRPFHTDTSTSLFDCSKLSSINDDLFESCGGFAKPHLLATEVMSVTGAWDLRLACHFMNLHGRSRKTPDPRLRPKCRSWSWVAADHCATSALASAHGPARSSSFASLGQFKSTPRLGHDFCICAGGECDFLQGCAHDGFRFPR